MTELRFLVYVILNEQEKNALGAAQASQQATLYQQALRFNLLNPTFTAQHTYNQLAQTELNHHQAFLQAALHYQA
jgi:hypothetical protein